MLTKPLRRSQLFNTVCRAVAAASAASSPDRPRPPVSGANKDNPALDLHILLAEDNDVNRRVATGLAERLGCRVDAVENGREALESLDYDRHDLVLMDVQMPEMDGFAATAAIRELEAKSGKHMPIVAMTAHAMQGDRDRCLAAGMDGYLTKPLRPGPFLEMLRAWSDARKQACQEAETKASPPAQSQAWFADSLRQTCGDNPTLITEVVGLMLKDTLEGFQRMEAVIAGKDGRRVSWEAHALKGVFLTVGAETLASECQELIRLGELGDFTVIESSFAIMRNQWNSLKVEAESYLEATHGR